jgi:hypothetical protein
MLYGHLIEKTGLIHIEPVKKHIQIFKTFVETNDEAIEGKNKKKLKCSKILYSEKVGIDLDLIFRLCDRDEESVVWNHLLTISAVLHPQGNAKQVLKDMKSNKSASGKEDNFLKNIMDTIGKEIGSQSSEDDINPMNLIGSMMSSGVMNEMFQNLSKGMNDGSMDLGSMMNSMQSLMGNLSNMVQESSKTTGGNDEKISPTEVTSSDDVAEGEVISVEPNNTSSDVISSPDKI